MTNLIGKWCKHRVTSSKSGEIVAITFDSSHMYLYTRQDDGTLSRIYYDNVIVLDRRPDTAGPYR